MHQYAPAVLLHASHGSPQSLVAGRGGATLIICAACSEQLDEMLIGIENTIPAFMGSSDSGGVDDQISTGTSTISESRGSASNAMPSFFRPVSNARKSIRRLTMTGGADRCESRAPVNKSGH